MIQGHCCTCGLFVLETIACAICGEEYCAVHAGGHVASHYDKVHLFLAANAANEKNKNEAAAERKPNV